MAFYRFWAIILPTFEGLGTPTPTPTSTPTAASAPPDNVGVDDGQRRRLLRSTGFRF